MKADKIELIHRGRYMCYYEIHFSDENGYKKVYEMVSKAGATLSGIEDLTLDNIGTRLEAVTLLILNKHHNKILVAKEFRMGVNRYVYSSVSGMVDAGESAKDAARRELKEKTGLDLTRVIRILKPSFTCAPVTDDGVSLVICEADGELTGSDSVNEDIVCEWVDKKRAIELLCSDEMLSGKMQAILYMWTLGTGIDI